MRGFEEERAELVEREMKAGRFSSALPLLVTLLAGSICYGLFFNRGLGLSVIGYSIAPAERVLQGEVPYRDFLFNYTPGVLWVNALLMKAFGPTLMATRIGLFAFKLASLIALFFVGRRLTNQWIALIPVGLTIAWLGYGQVFNVYPDQYLILFALVGLLSLLHYDETDRYFWLALCGLSGGVVFLFKYNVGVLLFVAGTASVAIRGLMITRRINKCVKAVSVYVAAFGVVAIALAVYLMSTGSFRAMVSHFLHHAAEYSESRSVGLPPPDTVMPAAMILIPVLAVGLLIFLLSRRILEYYFIAALVFGFVTLLRVQRSDFLNDAFLASVAYIHAILFLSAFGFLIQQLIKNRVDPQKWWNENGALAITGAVALAVYLEVFPRADYYHLVRVLPAVFLFLVALLYQKLPRLIELRLIPTSARTVWLLFSIPIVFLTAIGLNNTWAPEFDSGAHFRDNRELKIERGKNIFVDERQAELTEGLVQLIEANSSPGDYIFSFAQRGSALYFLANRRNPTRFLWWRSVGISDDERDAVMNMISNRRAKLIVVQDVAANKEIQDFIRDNYDHVGTVSDIAVYGLKKESGSMTSTRGSQAHAFFVQKSVVDLSRTPEFLQYQPSSGSK